MLYRRVNAEFEAWYKGTNKKVKKAFAGDLDADTIILNLSAMGYVLMILQMNVFNYVW